MSSKWEMLMQVENKNKQTKDKYGNRQYLHNATIVAEGDERIKI